MSKLRWLDYFFVASQFLLFGLYFWPLLEVPSLKYEAGWPALAASFLGLILIVVSLLQMRSSLSPWPRPKEGAYLITNGVFSVVRHPIYSGVFLIAVGQAFQTQSLYRLIIAVMLLVLFYFKSRYEERLLKIRFERYAQYLKKVGRFFPKLRFKVK